METNEGPDFTNSEHLLQLKTTVSEKLAMKRYFLCRALLYMHLLEFPFQRLNVWEETVN